MADDFENDEFETENDAEQNANSPKALREAYNKLKAQNAALEKAAAETAKKLKQRELADALEEKKIDKRVARFVPADADLDEWLKENGELFGVQPNLGQETQAVEQEQAPVAPHPLQAQFGQIDQVQQGATAPTGKVDLAKAQEALATGGLEAYEAFLRSGTQKA